MNLKFQEITRNQDVLRCDILGFGSRNDASLAKTMSIALLNIRSFPTHQTCINPRQMCRVLGKSLKHHWSKSCCLYWANSTHTIDMETDQENRETTKKHPSEITSLTHEPWETEAHLSLVD